MKNSYRITFLIVIGLLFFIASRFLPREWLNEIGIDGLNFFIHLAMLIFFSVELYLGFKSSENNSQILKFAPLVAGIGLALILLFNLYSLSLQACIIAYGIVLFAKAIIDQKQESPENENS